MTRLAIQIYSSASARFMPKHCREPLLKLTRYLASRGFSRKREGLKDLGEGKMVGLRCWRTDVIPTGVLVELSLCRLREGREG